MIGFLRRLRYRRGRRDGDRRWGRRRPFRSLALRADRRRHRRAGCGGCRRSVCRGSVASRRKAICEESHRGAAEHDDRPQADPKRDVPARERRRDCRLGSRRGAARVGKELPCHFLRRPLEGTERTDGRRHAAERRPISAVRQRRLPMRRREIAGERRRVGERFGCCGAVPDFGQRDVRGIRTAALVAREGRAVVHRLAIRARFERQRRGAIVAVLGAGRILVGAEHAGNGRHDANRLERRTAARAMRQWAAEERGA